MYSTKETRIVVVGRTGEGKSATGNMLLGERRFEAMSGASSTTKRTAYGQKYIAGRKVVVVDTPGVFDTKKEKNQITLEEIAKCLGISSPGPHAFLLVISSRNRFTTEVETSVQLLRSTFGERFLRNTIIVFTGKDDLDVDGQTVEGWMKDAPEYLTKLLADCNQRYIFVNNRLHGEDREKQARTILTLVEQLVEENQGRYFSSGIYEEVENKIQEMERAAKREIERKRLINIEVLNEQLVLLNDAKQQRLAYIEKEFKEQGRTEDERRRKEEEEEEEEEDAKKKKKAIEDEIAAVNRAALEQEEQLRDANRAKMIKTGAILGSVIPIIGTAIGALIGYIAGRIKYWEK